jgi:hypothetical protein
LNRDHSARDGKALLDVFDRALNRFEGMRSIVHRAVAIHIIAIRAHVEDQVGAKFE